MTLTEFLLARIADDEAVARKVPGQHFSTWNRSWDAGFRDLVIDAGEGGRLVTLPETMDEHVCRWDPARVLAECAAKRAIVEEHGPVGVDCRSCGVADEHGVDYPCPTLRILAAVYAEHPDYQEVWHV